MEREFTHIQNIFRMLREANISTSTIETVIDKLPLKQPEKRAMQILNTDRSPLSKSDYYQKIDLIDLYLTKPYEVRLCSVSYN